MPKYLDENGLSTLWSKITSKLSGKQDTLVSGTNIKTINGNSLLGSGNIAISTSGTIDSALSDTSTNPVQNKVITSTLKSYVKYSYADDDYIDVELEQDNISSSVYTTSYIDTALSGKQNKLVSGTNIKSINSNSLLSSGNLQLLEPNTNNITTGTTGSWEARFYNSSTGTYRTCHIVYGTVDINTTSFKNKTITFAKSMANSNYSIILTVTINNNTASREVFTSVYSRSTTGFVCNGHINNTSYKITKLHYIAIYIS